jgi:hypothetical protein
MSTQQNQGGGNIFAFLFILPILIITCISCFIAWVAACGKAGYRTVKLLSFPATFALTNMVGILFFIPIALILGVFVDKDVATYAFSSLRDLTMFPIWGPIISGFWNFGVTDFTPQIPFWHMAVYQIALYFIFGRGISRQVNMAVMDSAIQHIARNNNVNAIDYRELIIETNSAYAKHANYYRVRGKAPLLGIASVAFSGGSPFNYY